MKTSRSKGILLSFEILVSFVIVAVIATFFGPQLLNRSSINVDQTLPKDSVESTSLTPENSFSPKSEELSEIFLNPDKSSTVSFSLAKEEITLLPSGLEKSQAHDIDMDKVNFVGFTEIIWETSSRN